MPVPSLSVYLSITYFLLTLMRSLCTRPVGHFGIARSVCLSLRLSVCLSVPSRSCLGYRHAGCLQLSHRRPLEMCGLWTRPRTDVNPPRFLDPWSDADNLIGDETICHRSQRAFWPFCPSSDHGCRNGCLTCNLTKRNFMFTLYQLS